MVLGKLSVPGRPTIWITVGQGPVALAVGAGGGCLDIFTLICPFSPLSHSLRETARYRLEYCLKGPLNPKQPTNQPLSPSLWESAHYRLKYCFKGPLNPKQPTNHTRFYDVRAYLRLGRGSATHFNFAGLILVYPVYLDSRDENGRPHHIYSRLTKQLSA